MVIFGFVIKVGGQFPFYYEYQTRNHKQSAQFLLFLVLCAYSNFDLCHFTHKSYNHKRRVVLTFGLGCLFYIIYLYLCYIHIFILRLSYSAADLFMGFSNSISQKSDSLIKDIKMVRYSKKALLHIEFGRFVNFCRFPCSGKCWVKFPLF